MTTIEFIHPITPTAITRLATRGWWRLPAACIAFLLTLAGLATAQQAAVQCSTPPVDRCATGNCATTFISLNTGYDHVKGSVYETDSRDAYWTIAQDKSFDGNVPRDAYVIKAMPGWPNAEEGTQWIAASPDGVDDYFSDVTYERCFCVCGGPANYHFELSITVGDFATIIVDGAVITTIKAGGVPVATTVSFNLNLGAGRHCVEVRTRNTQLPHAGLNVRGAVTGPNLIAQTCCTDATPIQDPCCQTNRVVIVTDESWTITTGPAAFGPYPQCATIISNPPLWAWHVPFTGTNWIGTNANGTSGAPHAGVDTYVYHKSFCVEKDGTYIITITSMGDDVGTIYLNGVNIGTTGGFGALVTQTYIVGLTAGCNCFDVRVDDIGYVVTGLDMNIDIQGGLMLKQSCCDCSKCWAGNRAQRGGEGGNDASGVPANGGITDATRPTLVSVPNPATGEAVVHYVLDRNSDATVELFNSAGQRVMVVDAGARTTGQHEAPISTKGLAAGAYRLQLKYGEKTLSIPIEVR